MGKKHNALIIVGAIVLSLLLLYWLFTATLIQETEDLAPVPIEESAP